MYRTHCSIEFYHDLNLHSDILLTNLITEVHTDGSGCLIKCHMVIRYISYSLRRRILPRP